jgi:hypothetical protein
MSSSCVGDGHCAVVTLDDASVTLDNTQAHLRSPMQFSLGRWGAFLVDVKSGGYDL